ncbi:MarR family winged helix-turn-helix transcriptional regulator [Streptomyces sp. NPDC002176]|uniref:MarR family winged helix-turn-helix transcriptional regulator n=1 Tax=Streptomyces sp. NPDC002176 TaxID=3364634 RepID=UPI00384A6ACC
MTARGDPLGDWRPRGFRACDSRTNRVDRLVARGLVVRESVPGDRRRLHIALTDAGRDLVDRVAEGHVRNQRKILSGLEDTDRDELGRIPRELLVSLGDTP